MINALDTGLPSAARAVRVVSWWRRRSLRTRLTAASTAVIAVGVAAAAVLLVWRVHSTLVAGVDLTVSQRVSDVAAEAAQGQFSALRATGADSLTLVQVVAGDGHVVASSANIDGEAAQFSFPAPGSGVTVHAVAGSIAGDPGSYRVAAEATSSPAGPVTVYAARPTAEIDQSVRELVAALLIGGPVLVALLGAVAWALVGQALRPVETMRREVAAIPGTDLHRRLSLTPGGEELHRLAATFNELLARIDDGAAQQRRFLSDAAHELRNPVAALHTRLDVRASHPQLPLSPEDRQLLAADAARLAALVDSLLSLARLDADAALRREPVDLDDLVFDHVRRISAPGAPHIDATRVPAAQVIGDRSALDRVVANLFDNAVRHAHDAITVGLHRDGRDITLTVADDGPGVPAADRDRVFERFTRLDDARSRDRGGAGLGLAIVRDIVLAHGGGVHIDDNHPGARFTVTLPAAGS